MRTFLTSVFAAGCAVAATAALAEELSIPINAIDAGGVGAEIGTVMAADGPQGLQLTPQLTDLAPGPHGFHLHEKPDCAPAERDGQMTAGLAAGGHFDPEATKKHLGPTGQGHMGDLPLIDVGPEGTAANQTLVAPRLKVADLHGHALVIHSKGDNYSDSPESLGGAGGRIACGVVP
jgi:Cu-Zn family superoxide dismutase